MEQVRVTVTKRITRQALKKIGAGEILWDGELKGFGARRQKDAVTFFLKCRFKGKQRWVTIGRMGNPWTLETARTEALRRMVAITEGVDPGKSAANSEGVTLREGLERFINEHGPKLKEKSRYGYRLLCENSIVPRLGTLELDDADELTREISKFHRDLAATPRKANYVLMVLSSFFNWAEENGLRAKGTINPTIAVKRYRENKRDRFLSSKEMQRLGEVLAKVEADGSENQFALAAVRLLVLTGARLGEILTLKWAYVDKERARLRLPDSKTGAKIIRLNAAALAELEAVPRVAGNEYVIVGDCKGKHFRGMQKVWQRLRKAAEIEDVRLHDLRHSFASVGVEKGMSLPVIGKLLGHSQVKTTSRYAHLTDTSVDRANEDIGAEIESVLGSSAAAAKLQQGEAKDSQGTR